MTTGAGGREGELDPQAAATLRAFRAEEDMSAAAQARVWARLAASTSAEPTWSKGHVPRRRSEWAWAALAVAVAAALLLASRAGVLGPLVGAREGGEAAAYSERREAATEPVRAAAESGPIEHVVQDMVRETDDRAVESEAAATEPAVSAAGRASEAKSEPRARARADAGEPARSKTGEAASASAQTSETSSSLAQEAEALARAQAAIQSGRPDEALVLLAGYAQQFPRGALREEHDALRALALCAGDRAAEGRAAAAVFLRAHGGSALAERVRQGCAGE